jgi:caa(3)-type oxidase subunit IV
MASENSENHASVKLYWIICVVLCAITFVEWGIFQFESIRTNAAIMIPSLLIMSIAKFILVCGWYMHLKYDHPILKQYYIASFFLATAVMIALGVLML